MILFAIKIGFWIFAINECITLLYPGWQITKTRKWIDKLYILWTIAVILAISPWWGVSLLALSGVGALVIFIDQIRLQGGIKLVVKKTKDRDYISTILPRYFWLLRLDAGLSLLLLLLFYHYTMYPIA